MKKGVKLKNTGDLSVYKPFVDEELKKWLNPLMKSAGVEFAVSGKENIPVDDEQEVHSEKPRNGTFRH